MAIFYFIALCLLPFGFCTQALAQKIQFKQYTTEHGLAENQVRTIFQDRNGYLWIGTAGNGVSRFDGLEFQNFNKQQGLNNLSVWSIHENAAGNILIGTEQGLFISYKSGHQTFFKYFPDTNSPLNNRMIRSITEDKNNNLWVATDLGLFKIRLINGNSFEIKQFNTKNGLLIDRISSLLYDSNNKLWVGYYNGGVSVLNLNNDDFNFTNLSELLGNPSGNIESIKEDNFKNIWICIPSEGIICFKNGKIVRKYSSLDGIGYASIKDIIQDKNNGYLLITFGGGINQFTIDPNTLNIKEITTYNVSDGLPINNFWSVLEDIEGNIWLGTYGAGLLKLMEPTYQLYDLNDGLSSKFIWSVYRDKEENLWVGAYNGGISFIPAGKASFQLIPFENKNFDFTVHAFAEDENNNVWLGTSQGLFRVKYDLRKNKLELLSHLTADQRLNNNRVMNVVVASQNNIIACTLDGVAIIKKRAQNYYVAEKILRSQFVYSAVQDEDKNYWFATRGGGVFFYDRKEITGYNTEKGLAHNDVRSIVIDKHGLVWFGTGGGISIFIPSHKMFKNLTSKDGLSSDRIYFLHIDNNDSILWIGTNLGIDKLDLIKYRKIGEPDFYHYTHLDGFIEVETNTNAVFQDKDGILWIGTINGLIKFNPDLKKGKNTITPTTIIEKITINRSDTMLYNSVALPYSFNNFTFHFTATSLTLPEKVKYQYKLDGIDPDWSPVTKSRSTTYNNLEPKTYTFMVKACNNDGLWNDTPTTITFTITPPYWETAWFYSAQLLFFMLLIGATLLMSRRTESKGEKRVMVLVYICLFVIFDFIQTLSEPMYENFAGGAPIIKTLLNLAFASLLLPAQTWLRNILRGRRRRLLENEEE